jgi:hypothetical protein
VRLKKAGRAASNSNKIGRRAMGFAAYQLLNKIACSLKYK